MYKLQTLSDSHMVAVIKVTITGKYQKDTDQSGRIIRKLGKVSQRTKLMGRKRKSEILPAFDRIGSYVMKKSFFYNMEFVFPKFHRIPGA